VPPLHIQLPDFGEIKIATGIPWNFKGIPSGIEVPLEFSRTIGADLSWVVCDCINKLRKCSLKMNVLGI
jgi:hypothetical protein